MEREDKIRWSRAVRPGAPGSRTTRLELFYDLVFVFAFLNVTDLTAADLSWQALFRCVLVLALLWWCWSGFAALGNAVRTDQGTIPLVGFVTTAAVFVLALAIPSAFVEIPGGLHGPVVFAACYFLVRVLQVGVFGWVVRSDPDLRQRWLLLLGPVLIATALLVVAGLVPQRVADGGAERPLRLVIWLVAIGVEYGAGLALPGTGWTVISAGHWAERHALIVLIALGESIISLGLGPELVSGLPLTAPVVVAAVVGIAIVAVLWWAYFDSLALGVEQALHRARMPAARAALARNAYTYLHLPMVAGVILFALALKRLLHTVSDPDTPPWGASLPVIEVVSLYGGVILYLAALAVLGAVATRNVRWPPVTAVAVLIPLITLAHRLPGLVALVLLATVCALLLVVQLVADAPNRRTVRETALQEQLAAEAEQTEWRRRYL
ncbi:low temperature requirement protein A [Micromonospora sp. WMMA1363]|uniref:low temperature requirement protein A n=1 Tax=Micromonospora sp. WMMA1363 TaxID=3053985 RepID=UPI00259CDAAD|nr:low temperature requirement protein A [Micromonospora sp. WMMA1363]MDM4719947.1 low temperature requirement protein A [Micromonospora sp. WMMA1363]